MFIVLGMYNFDTKFKETWTQLTMGHSLWPLLEFLNLKQTSILGTNKQKIRKNKGTYNIPSFIVNKTM